MVRGRNQRLARPVVGDDMNQKTRLFLQIINKDLQETCMCQVGEAKDMELSARSSLRGTNQGSQNES